MDDGSEYKKAKGTKTCVIKRKLMFENYKDCLLNEKTYLRNNKYLNVIIMMWTQKIALSSNDNKRIKKFERFQHFHTE